jgi:hypothetical protein
MRDIKGVSENEQLKTMSLYELVTTLSMYIKQNRQLENYRVYLSTDPEGNGYSTLNQSWSFQFGDDDKILTIMPYNEGLQDEDIAPIEHAKVMEQIKKEKK